ncbi:MAG: serine/threonine-protein kinase [Gemmataceae bacterium]
MADTGQVIAGYKLRGLLHTGRESQVWEVVELASNRHLAMKLLLPEFAQSKAERAKLFNDADIGKQLRHENVVYVQKVNRSPDQPNFIMEYFPAGSLRRRLQSRDPKDKEYLKVNAKKIFKQTATGLAYMNASGFVHLDVKPDNIVANASAQTKIIDFAISRPIQKGFLAKLFRKKGLPEGTPTYMSPEQIRTELLDGRSDIYSLGITWYEVVTGRPPFRGNSVADLYRKHFGEKPALPSNHNPDVTDEFGALVLKMVAKKREDRFKSFHEVLIELKKVKVFKSLKDEDEDEMMGMGMMG